MISPPASFVTVRDILDQKVRIGALIHLIGIIIDFQAPISTAREDWKCRLRLLDLSTQGEPEPSVCLNIFRAKNEMPDVNCGDVVLLKFVKVQKFQRDDPFSLISNVRTSIRIFAGAKIPKPPSDPSCALQPSLKQEDSAPTIREMEYVSLMFHEADKSRVPNEAESEIIKLQATSFKEKFRLLQDVKEGQFCDITAQVVKAPFRGMDNITLWISDYTENEAFFNFDVANINSTGGQDGDSFGYVTKYPVGNDSAAWQGPCGKYSMQVTCYEPHASAILDRKISDGSWVLIRNLQVKWGRNVANLEGFLRGDRDAKDPKINIFPLNYQEDSTNVRLKEAIRRKRDYEKSKKARLKDVQEAAMAGQKRKTSQAARSEAPKKQNSSARRRIARDAKFAAPQDKEKPSEELALNPLVKCENEVKQPSTIAEVLEPVYETVALDGQNIKLRLPFVNAKYRSLVRIVDFMPSRLEDFASPRKTPPEFDILSDNSDAESNLSSGSDSESEIPRNDAIWEWKFWLKLEDAVATDPKKSVWVLVDNSAAQLLTNLDATDLRDDHKILAQLEEGLFTIWGNLKEIKSKELELKSRQAVKANGPPDHSDEEQEKESHVPLPKLSNMPFSCCIQQYGIRVKEADKSLADAGAGNRWERIYGLFGTRIIP